MIITDMKKLRAGMRVSQEVVTLNGQVILEAGTELNESNINFLLKNEVGFIEIEEVAIEDRYTQEEFRLIREEIEEKTKKLFKDCIEDKYMRELYKIVCEIKFIEILNGY
ncbi:MAG: hypothetical protein FWG20_01195 [Candidatus Cloacimonetes bacterium]|nr:hypothetical protein [Candidatus Cloacimonadota bacterium]